MVKFGAKLFWVSCPFATFSFGWVINNIGFKQAIRLSLFQFSIGFLLFFWMEYKVCYFLGFFTLGLANTYLLTLVTFLMMAIMPNRVGFACGIARMGSCVTPVLYAYLSHMIINPNNDAPSQTNVTGEQNVKIFDETVADNLPTFIYICFGVYFLTAIVLPEFIYDPEVKSREELYANPLFQRTIKSSSKNSVNNETPKEKPRRLNSAQDYRPHELNSPNVVLDTYQPKSHTNFGRPTNKQLFASLIFFHKKDTKEEQNIIDYRYRDSRKSSNFITVFVCMTISWGCVFYLIGNFKSDALTNFNDKVATQFSPLLLQCIFSNYGSGVAIDKLGWKNTCIVFNLLLVIASFSLMEFMDTWVGFYICYFMFYVCNSAFDVLIGCSTEYFYGRDVGIILFKYYGFMYLISSFVALGFSGMLIQIGKEMTNIVLSIEIIVVIIFLYCFVRKEQHIND